MSENKIKFTILDNLKLLLKEGFKEFFLSLQMNSDEKRMYLIHHKWVPSKFFEMKRFSFILECQGRLLDLDYKRREEDVDLVTFTRPPIPSEPNGDLGHLVRLCPQCIKIPKECKCYVL